MSEHHNEIICPNCNHPATGNYCAECGQPTHMHNDTFIGLVSHFISHYFHFDSKFWKTIKTLITKPGKLDTAYHDKQRMRYIEPISLYIFVSVVFFILVSFLVRFEQTTEVNGKDRGFTMTHSYSFGLHNKIKMHHNDKWVVDFNCDSLRQVRTVMKELEDNRKGFFQRKGNEFHFSYSYFFETFYNYYIFPYAYRHQMYDVDAPVTVVYNKFIQLIPKIFFVLMPLMALLLYMTFFNKRGYKFVDYAVMSLHTHVFMFISGIVLLLGVGSVTDASKNIWLILFFIVIPLVHFILSCKNFFHKSWIYTIIAGTITWGLYLSLVLLVSVITLLSIISYT